MKEEHRKLSKYTGGIYRCTQAFTSEILKPFGLSSGCCSYLLTLNNNDGMNQNQISRELNVDKAMSARELKKLIQKGYVKKEADKNDTRAYKLSLTDQGRRIIPEIHRELSIWNNAITSGLEEEEKEELLRMLDVVLQEARRLRSVQKEEWRS